GVLALSGSIEDKAISLEGENILAFYVEPAESGEGTVTLVIKLPAGSGITEAKVFKDGVEHGSPIPPVADTIAFTETSLTGAYYYSFKLYNAEPKLLGVVSEVVYVWANLESEKTYTLLQKDLNLTYTIRYHVPDEPMADGHYQIATAVTLAAPSPRDGYYFKGWYEQADLSGSAVTRIPVGSTGDKAFYSKWIPQRLSTDTLTPFSLANALALIKADAGEGDVYTIIVNTDETLAPQTLSYDGKTVSITLEGGAEKWIVCLSSNGALFALESGVTLKLGNITLQGKSGNTASLVTVSSGATLEINAGAKISGNTKSGNDGGGVYVNGGTLTMTGGEISDNTTNSGGGVSLYNNSRFTMSGGYISNNFSKSGTGGGGVRLENSKFTMSGGTISGNTTAGGSGGGVRVNTSSMFTMSGGTISGNTTAGNVGGGVYTSNTFTMTGGTISGNIASSNGGGVYASSKFTMSGGTISGNTTTNGNGGGVYGGITKSGGTIYGSEADEPLKNTAGSGAGHAAYAAADKVRDSTAGVGADLNSAQSGAAGGWELPATFSPSQSLEWIRANAGDGDVYTITLTTDESLAPQTLSYDGKTVSVTLEGEGAERTVSLSSNGSLFTVGKGVTLKLADNITLLGKSSNNAALVMVHSGGALEMNAGSKISGNATTSDCGSGVRVEGGTFTMYGGEISGNSASSWGGGVFIYNGAFIMHDGIISGNSSPNGGGVHLSDKCTFTMKGGTISGNTTSTHGGGVYLLPSTTNSFIMEGGIISGNTASGNGGGVWVGGTFTKSGGTIYGADASDGLKNTAESNDGHAVYVAADKKHNSTAGAGVTLDSGSSDNWE
ncbi:MAG: right-handed parallel beta-helix repeat-containing protein, partial [Treponema sp.]|nr:right-handed parallel beta-helix repeat-containing protein [Treponema sp.]